MSASTLQSQTPAPADSLTGLFASLIAKRIQANVRADTAAYHHLVDPALVYFDDDGSRQDFSERMRRIATGVAGGGAGKFRRDVDSLHVVVTGEVAFVDYWIVVRVPFGPRTRAEPYRNLDTFIRRGGEWLLIRHAETHALSSPSALVVAPSLLADYVGRYEWWPGYVDTITLAGGQLFERGTGEAEAALNIAASPEAFFVKGDPSLIVFVRNRSGRVTGYVLHWPDGQITAARKVAAGRSH